MNSNINALARLFPNFFDLKQLIISETIETIKMVVISGSIAFVIGMFIAILLVLFRKGGLKSNKLLFSILDGIINLLRAIPFVILLVAIFPLTRLITKTTLGLAGSIVPLVFASAPFFARQFESALLEVDYGLIEAALAMGANDVEIIFKVYLREALPGIVRASTITLVNLLGLTTMVGAIAGGGIGDLALMYGLRRNMLDITYIAVIIILLLVYIIQISGSLVLKYLIKGE